MGIIKRFFEKLLFKGAPFPFSVQPCKDWQLIHRSTDSHIEYSIDSLMDSIIEDDVNLREKGKYTCHYIYFEVKDLSNPNVSGELFIQNSNSSSDWCFKFHVTSSKGVISVELSKVLIDEKNFIVIQGESNKEYIGRLVDEDSVKAFKDFLRIHGAKQEDGS